MATHFENRGPRDWQPVTVTTRFGAVRGLPCQPFPLAPTRPLAPRNVAIEREDGSRVVKPVRTLRRVHPGTGVAAVLLDIVSEAS